MGNFSKDPLQVLTDNLLKGYVGLHLQQGVPLLDRDINLMQDFLMSTVRQLALAFFGNGIFASAGNAGFRIQGLGQPNDFEIQAGSALAEGIVVKLDLPRNYSAQADLPPLTIPSSTQPDPRQDAVYLDVWLDEVTAGVDPMLENGDDIGVETSVRLLPTFRIRVAEGTIVPDDPKLGHVHIPLAVLTRPRNVGAIQAAHVTDGRKILVRLSDLDLRLNAIENTIAPRITGIDPPIQNVNSNITITGANFDQVISSVTFKPLNAAISSLPGTVVGAPTATQVVVTVPNFPGLPGNLPCRIRVQTAIGVVESNEVSTPFSINDSVA